jgi:ATP-dependent helicase/nuclease subunit B
MPTIASVSLDPAWRPAGLWPELAERALAWLEERALPVRDAVLLVPFAGLLEPARVAFAARGGWPRVETALTLAASLAAPAAPAAGQCSGNAALDRLSATQLLRGLAWGRAWATRDPPGFSALVDALVQAAASLREAAAGHAPHTRAAFWERARAAIGEAPAGASIESLLLQVALAWAEAALPPATDVLFRHRPSAWIALRLGGADPVAEALLAEGGVPALRLAADPDPEDPFAANTSGPAPRQLLCQHFEDEAAATAAAVIEALNAGAVPVALVALDRELLRRVRALLDRAGVPLIDETGWKLATTAAAARLIALLQAAAPEATRDEQLRWLKGWPLAEPAATRALEALWRRRRHVEGTDAAQALWARAQAHLAPLREPRELPLAQWLQRLAALLQADGTLAALQAAADGQQVLQTIGLPQAASAAWAEAAAQLRFTLAEFTAWVQGTLEQATFLPLPDAGAAVLITPLARAYGRRFAQVVVPATDHRHLGAEGPQPGLIGDALAARLGLPDAAERRRRQHIALSHAMRADAVLLLRRLQDEQEPLADSPALQWLQAVRERAGQPPAAAQAWQPALQTFARRPVQRPEPSAPDLLPAQLSASQLDALRQCPYRFFARAQLGLDEPEELEAALAKRDYGNWLHLVLHRFHDGRMPGGDDAALLQAAASAATRELGLDEGELLPFAASFERLAPAYLAWLHGREAEGWLWAEGESDHQLSHPLLPGLRLRGRVDRIDHGPDGRRLVVDYKTGAVAGLKKKAADPLEDTQLAFYAALLGGPDGDPALGACYLALDDEAAPLVIEHPAVHESGATLIAGLADEWQRLREGTPLPALGEGTVCETCEARGLCRRDHWAA